MPSKNGSEANSQEHGHEFEHFIRDSGRFPNARGTSSSPGRAIDIEPEYDRAFSLHTSVKMTKGSTVGLADAVRFYENDRPFRFIIGIWEQTTDEIKSIHEIREIVITSQTLKRLKGGITLAEIKAIQSRYSSFESGPAGKIAATIYSDKIKKSLASRKGLVDLAFKGDDETQRRLQLSIRLKTLTNAAADDPFYAYLDLVTRTVTSHRSEYHGHAMPIDVYSRPRLFANPEIATQSSLGYEPVINVPTAEMIAVAEARQHEAVRVDDAARTSALRSMNSGQLALI